MRGVFIRWIAAIAAANFFAVLCPASATTVAPTRIDVRDKCEANTACIIAPVDIAGFKDEQVELPSDLICGRVFVDARARLNGGAVKVYRVYFAAGCLECHEGDAPLAGYSAKGHPLVQTRAGLLEILDRKVAIGQVDSLFLIHAQTGKIAAKYWGPSHAYTGFVFRGGRVYIGDRDGGCVVAPSSRPQLLTRAVDGCTGSDDVVFMEEPTPAAKATVDKLTTGEDGPIPFDLYKVSGTEFIAMTLWDQCE